MDYGGKTKKVSILLLETLLSCGSLIMPARLPGIKSMASDDSLLDYLPGSGWQKVKFTERKQMRNTFYYLKKHGFINMDYRGKQLYISLTSDGQKKARTCELDKLKISRPGRWDGKWRLMIFDILDKQKIKREALRGKIKELGLFQLQKSVWAYPYDFKHELNMLSQFFDFTSAEINYIVAEKIENDKILRKHFKLV